MSMNKIPSAKRAQILGLMVEGVSLRAITRITGVSKNTATTLVESAGQAFSDYKDRVFRNLPCKRPKVDEIWSFIYEKAKNVPFAKSAPEEAGDIWTWTALCADTKLIPSWFVGSRDADAARAFISDLASRLANRIQLISDGHGPYLQAVEDAFGADIDYEMLKKYDAPQGAVGRYSPGECVGVEQRRVEGRPDQAHVSTSCVERSNLSIRIGNRRMTRLTNIFSKKATNHSYAMAIYFMHYNFVRIHGSLRCTLAMASGVTPKFWELADMVKVLEGWEASQ